MSKKNARSNSGIKDARRWFFKGERLTAPTKKVELRTAGSGDKKAVVSTCAIGAMQVGYTAEQLRGQAGNPKKFKTVKRMRDNAEGFWAAVGELWDAYEEAYGVTIEWDNDTHGRDFVHERIENLR